VVALVAILYIPPRLELRRVPNPSHYPHYATSTVRHVRHSLPSAQCKQCGQAARRVWEVSRTAIDVDLDHPVLLLVTVSVHRCCTCSRHFPKFSFHFSAPMPSMPSGCARRLSFSVYEDGVCLSGR
jgi:hypothetical protein